MKLLIADDEVPARQRLQALVAEIGGWDIAGEAGNGREAVERAVALGVDAVLLDNMGVEMLAEAVKIVAGRAVTEASGNIVPETVAAKAATGVDLLSAGWLTHSAANLDVALDIVA